MAKLLLYSFLLILSQSLFSQDKTIDLNKKEVQELRKSGVEFNTNVFKFGLGLGFNYLLEEVYDPVISPINNHLELQKINPFSFVLSTSVVVNPISFYYRALDSEGNAYGKAYSHTFPISFIATLNLAQFGSAQATSFNKKIDGGLGVGWRLNEDFHIAVTYEMIAVRQLRDYISDTYKGKPIIVNNVALRNLDKYDNNYFIDKYQSGLSIKFIYILLGNNERLEHNPSDSEENTPNNTK